MFVLVIFHNFETAVRNIHIMVATGDCELRQLDVKQLFISVDLDYDVYMKLLDDRAGKRSEMMKINKALYGLKQAGHQKLLRLILRDYSMRK